VSSVVELVQRVVREELARRRDGLLGVVTATYPHAAEDDDNNLEIDVRLKHEDLELRRVPVGVSHVGAAVPPRVGDLVLVRLVDGQLNQPLVTSVFYHADERPPLAQENEVLLEHRVPDGTLNHLRFQADGSMLLQRDVTKPADGSEAKTTIRIDGASGDVRLQAGDEIVVELKHGSELVITCDGKPITIGCKSLDLTCDDGMTVHGNVEVKGDLKVSATAHSTTISGNEITGT
jgi:phage baseplate assembly protein gpV